MCELFAVSSEHPVKLTYELNEFATHGGQRYSNRDGWGIVFAQPRDAYLFKEPSAGSVSALEAMVARHPPLSQMMMAHVRWATAGPPALANTHPFQRRIHGQTHSFAHNGDLPELKARYAGSVEVGECIGDTDSELAFMILLGRLAQLNQTATPADHFDVFAAFCHEMRQLGDSNFLYGQDKTLFIHAHKRRYEDSLGHISVPREPGLHLRQIPREQLYWQVRGARIQKHRHGSQLLIASVPLDDEPWQSLPEGTALMLLHGREIMRTPS